MRRTIIVAGGTAAAARRLELARKGQHGTDVRTIEQVAERLAGGFLRLVDGDTLAHAAADALAAASSEALGDLQSIADLPGLAGTLASTLNKAWVADVDLAQEAARTGMPRVRALAGLEQEVLNRLPPGMLAPRQLARRALSGIARSKGAFTLLGQVELDRLMDVPRCWQVMLLALCAPHGLRWRSGPLPVPAWWDRAWKLATDDDLATPETRSVTCATARHEVIEAMRWARGLLASGNVQAGEIAFAAASPSEYDDLVLAIGREASLDLHFAHGRRALATRDGQAAAALADVLLHGLSQDRVRRLARMAHAPGTPFGALPEDWASGLPRSAPLGSPHRWAQAAAAASVPADVTAVLLPAIDLLASGPAEAARVGETFLRGAPLLLWRRALGRAPASALEATLGALRLPDTNEAATSIGWMHAATLACCPRPYVWLFGLNARTWPRAAAEDPLLPDHVIPAARLDPLPITQADRLAFHAIQGSTARQLVCSASRRDATGRLLGLSPLMPSRDPERLARARVPEHAMSEQDRMMARPAEFAGTARATSAHACWQDWNDAGVTPHDGQVRPGHPALAHAVDRVHSATSLKTLLRNPLGFTWRYALGWREPDAGAEALELDAMQFGSLVHAMLDAALPTIEAQGGLAAATPDQVAAAVHAARGLVAGQWEAEAAVPPALLWTLTLDRAEQMAAAALAWPVPAFRGGRSFAEVAFGGMAATNAVVPWDPVQPVVIPGTPIHIQGRIDRLDLSADGKRARLVDYKTGKPRDPGILNGGGELQRCLYAYVVQSTLGAAVQVEAALLYPRGDGAYHPLPATQASLDTLTAALLEARASLLAGRALIGPDTGGGYDDLAFALPASPGAMTERKREAAQAALGPAATIWDHA